MKHNTTKNFTLMELVITLTIMSIIAGGAVAFYDGFISDAEYTTTKAEMQTIRKALLQFKTDMGVLPGQGKLSFSNLDLDGKPQEWFESHANVIQLFEQPLDSTTPDRHDWNKDRRRGWRGPYLSQDGNGLVSIGKNSNYDSGTIIEDVYALGDGFEASAQGSYYVWKNFGGSLYTAKHGRPYLFLDFDTDDARIVSMGPDNTYGTTDDITLYLFK